MADTKTSALGTITGANTATGDKFPVLDVSDTTQGAGGTLKTITRAEMVAALDAAGMTVNSDLGTAAAQDVGYFATAAQGSTADSALQSVAADTTPQLGGSLDVSGNKIVSVTDGNIDIEPHGTGNVLLGNFTFDADQAVGAGQDNYVLTYDHAGGVIALEAAAGGGGTPGGSDTHVQFNDGGAFGGDAGITFNKTAKTLTLGGGTVTTAIPVLDLSQTWNDAAITQTLLKANVTDTASAAGSLLMDLQVGGVSKITGAKLGRITVNNTESSSNTFESRSGENLYWYTNSWAEMYLSNAGAGFKFGSSAGVGTHLWLETSGMFLNGAMPIAWGSSAASGAIDTYLRRDAANTLALRNGANAQTFRLYETWTDASNYSRAYLSATSTAVTLGSEAAGTGTRRSMVLNGNNRAAYDAAPSTTVIRDILISHGLMAAA